MTHEVTISVPADVRFAGVVRVLAAQVAREAGCDAGAAEAFGAEVDAVVAARLAGPCETGSLVVVVRRMSAQVEVRVTGGRTVTVAGARSLDV